MTNHAILLVLYVVGASDLWGRTNHLWCIAHFDHSDRSLCLIRQNRHLFRQFTTPQAFTVSTSKVSQITIHRSFLDQPKPKLHFNFELRLKRIF